MNPLKKKTNPFPPPPAHFRLFSSADSFPPPPPPRSSDEVLIFGKPRPIIPVPEDILSLKFDHRTELQECLQGFVDAYLDVLSLLMGQSSGDHKPIGKRLTEKVAHFRSLLNEYRAKEGLDTLQKTYEGQLEHRRKIVEDCDEFLSSVREGIRSCQEKLSIANDMKLPVWEKLEGSDGNGGDGNGGDGNGGDGNGDDGKEDSKENEKRGESMDIEEDMKDAKVGEHHSVFKATSQHFEMEVTSSWWRLDEHGRMMMDPMFRQTIPSPHESIISLNHVEMVWSA
eukprot:TRINITY_DN1391_c0_g1_i1.p1 TRINITY_DN1391_c0_g1~~TRINITY_DN1391_c0_g1_i1.p1  ORF type:complete len:283 (-),score=102.00 TRINITY_DN1391_c0_g1_i1:216-1064(-)